MAAEIVIDLIHPSPVDYSGKVVDWKHTDDGKKPVIKPFSTSAKEIFSPLNNRKKVFPYVLTEKNVEDKRGVGRADLIVLRPTRDIPNFTERDYKNSFYASKLDVEDSERVRELTEEIDQKEQEIKRLKRKIEQGSSVDEDPDGDNSSQGPSMFKCGVCREKSRESHWMSEDHNKKEYCPSCGDGILKNAEEV